MVSLLICNFFSAYVKYIVEFFLHRKSAENFEYVSADVG